MFWFSIWKYILVLKYPIFLPLDFQLHCTNFSRLKIPSNLNYPILGHFPLYVDGTVVVFKLTITGFALSLLHVLKCIVYKKLSLNSSITLSHMSIYCLDRQDSRGGDLLTAINPSLPFFELQLPSYSVPGLEALEVSVFYDENWIFIINMYSPDELILDSWLSDVTSLCGSPFICAWGLGTSTITSISVFPICHFVLIDSWNGSLIRIFAFSI